MTSSESHGQLVTVPENHKRLVASYVLWACALFGVSGLHRLYNGKIATGLLWLCTLGLFGVGQFIDVFFVPGMAEDYELKRFKSRYKSGAYDLFSSPTAMTSQTVKPPTREEKMVKLLKAAQSRDGQLSVTQAVMDTSMGFEEVETLLKDMVKSGYVTVDNHTSTGVVVYRFDELMS
ncbi:MAG: NINE protein [Leptolyngbya sp. SIO1D8]|nr:NINE protein [Leptolyngbya sp. SIO1D8]